MAHSQLPYTTGPPRVRIRGSAKVNFGVCKSIFLGLQKSISGHEPHSESGKNNFGGQVCLVCILHGRARRRARYLHTTKGPMWGHPVPVLGAISPFLEPFHGRLSPNIDNVSEKLTLRYPHEGPWVGRAHLPQQVTSPWTSTPRPMPPGEKPIFNLDLSFIWSWVSSHSHARTDVYPSPQGYLAREKLPSPRALQ